MVLNSGFMLVRVPPGGSSGVPFGEIILILFLLSFIGDKKWLLRFLRNNAAIPIILWWILGIGQAIAGVFEYGWWALRDATHVIESLFLWVGFVFAANPSAIDRFFVALRRILAIGCIYAFTYPFREELKGFSPTIRGAAAYTTTIIFTHYTNTATMVLMAASRRVIISTGSSDVKSLLTAGILIAYTVAFFQARTIYLQLFAIMILFFWHNRATFGRLSVAMMVLLSAFLLLALSGIEFTGRLGQTISVDFVFRHFAAIWGVESEGVVGAARGVDQRFGWWLDIWRRVTDNARSLLFGLGYGFPLIDFKIVGNIPVREPHNSFISIFGRLGLSGVILFVTGHAFLLRAWFRAYDLCCRFDYRQGRDRLLIFMVYFVLMWVHSLAEDSFEKPFFTIPYYFFWGIVLHYRMHLNNVFAETDSMGLRAAAPGG